MLLLPGRAATLGSGSHVYEFEPDWGKLPNGKQYGYTHGVVMDSQQRILIHNRSKDAVIIFDNDGKFVKSWGEDFEQGAHGMATALLEDTHGAVYQQAQRRCPGALSRR